MTSNPFSRRTRRSIYPPQVLGRTFRGGVRRRLLCFALMLAVVCIPGIDISVRQGFVVAFAAIDKTPSYADSPTLLNLILK